MLNTFVYAFNVNSNLTSVNDTLEVEEERLHRSPYLGVR